MASTREDFASAEKRPASRHCAKRLECEQLAAALHGYWTAVGSGTLDRLATFESGSKLLALQTLREAILRYSRLKICATTVKYAGYGEGYGHFCSSFL